MFSIQVNDLCDRKIDEAVGKKRWIYHLPINAGIALSIALVTMGLAIILLINSSIQVISAYTATILLALFYSLPPVRFKNRGLLGLACYALSAAIIYVLVPWTWFNSDFPALAFLFPVVFLDKWVQLHFHQVIDYHADLKTGVNTYAARVGVARAYRTLKHAAMLASLSIISLLLFVIFLARIEIILRLVILSLTAIVLIASVVYRWILSKQDSNGSDLIKKLPWYYLVLTYLVFCVLPPAVLIFLALAEPRIWILAVLSAFSFLALTLQSVRYKYT